MPAFACICLQPRGLPVCCWYGVCLLAPFKCVFTVACCLPLLSLPSLCKQVEVIRTRVPWLEFEEKREAYEEVKKVGQQLPLSLPVVVV